MRKTKQTNRDEILSVFWHFVFDEKTMNGYNFMLSGNTKFFHTINKFIQFGRFDIS